MFLLNGFQACLPGSAPLPEASIFKFTNTNIDPDSNQATGVLKGWSLGLWHPKLGHHKNNS